VSGDGLEDAIGTSPDATPSLSILGSIQVVTQGRSLVVGGEKPRRLLGMLILHRNAMVSTDQLLQAIWGDDLPESGTATLQSYVSRLRRVLPPPIELISEPPGYRLAVGRAMTDVDRFEDALATGMDQLDSDPTAALACLDDALAEWRGDALAEFSDESWARGEAVRLQELRLHASEARLTALLALGMDEAAASDAESLTVDHPWRERPWRALLLALHHMGRQGDALRKANEYRERLRDDLGLDPSVDFVMLEREVAMGDARRDRVLSSTSESAPAPPPDPARAVEPMPPSGLVATRVQLIGRSDDLAGLVELCGRTRLVTLVGPGGIGKTQLAIAVAAQLGAIDRLHGEVVDLAPVRDESNVVAAIATQLQVQPQQGRSVTESVLDVLGHRTLLLVLDNCEHVLDAIAGFVERLLRICPGVRVLATSREPLALPAETVFKVPTLLVAAEGSDLGHHIASPAVELFMQRARAANADVPSDEPTVRAVAELCRRLDGVPLAIELAAARTRSLSPAEIIARLGDRFALLAGSSRVADQRHRSLKDLVDWSYQLLDPVEQQLFRRLSIFAGSFDLDAAEHVCGYGQVPRNMVASVLAGLVDKSMVQASTGTRTTYRLLETLREFGAALDEGEAPQIARRHGAWILDICERGAVGLHGTDERWWLDTLDDLFDDLRLAVRHALDAGDLDTALGVVVAAREHAFRRLRYELIGWAETALAERAADGHRLAAAGWGIVAYGRFVRGEIDAAIELGERSVELAARDGTDALGLPERALGNAYVFTGDIPRFTIALERLAETAVAAGDDARMAHAFYMCSLSETRTAGIEIGMQHAQRAAEAAARSGNPTAQAQAAYAAGIWAAADDAALARALLQRSEQLARDVGNLWFELFARTETLWLQAIEGDPRGALIGFADVISAWHRAGDWANQWLSLRHVLGICLLLRADDLAATIHGALDRAGAVNAFPFQPAAAADLARQLTELRERMGDQRFIAAQQQGNTTSTSVVIDLIVSQIRAL
jgi:predicted ATPase/DNA-binding SARP family transcriptional activator